MRLSTVKPCDARAVIDARRLAIPLVLDRGVRQPRDHVTLFWDRLIEVASVPVFEGSEWNASNDRALFFFIS